VLFEKIGADNRESIGRLVAALEYALSLNHTSLKNSRVEQLLYDIAMHGFKESPPVHNDLTRGLNEPASAVRLLRLVKQKLLLSHIVLVADVH